MGGLAVKTIEAAKPRQKEYLLSDGDGLYLRVRPNGRKDWLLIFTFAGKRRKLALGPFSDVELAEARRIAIEQRNLIRNDVDPQLEKQRKQREEQAARKALEARQRELSVNGLFERWAETDLQRRKDGGAEIRRMFTKDVLPLIGAVPAKEIGKQHITGVTDKLLRRGVNRMAKLIFSLMRQMFRFGVDRGIVDFDPTAAIRKAAIGGQDTERDRVLSEQEITALYRQIPNAKLTQSTEAAIWIALSTCCRIGELLSAKWQSVDLENGIWKIPAENSKNGKAHTVFLSEFAQEQFEALREKQIGKPSEWLYPGRDRTKAVCIKTISKQLGDRQLVKNTPMTGRVGSRTRRTRTPKDTKPPITPHALVLSGGRWTPHDLRRTGATMMVALGVLPEVAERCLNHVEENKVKRIYQRHSYENEMREAWRLLGERLALLTSAVDNVSIMQRSA